MILYQNVALVTGAVRLKLKYDSYVALVQLTLSHLIGCFWNYLHTGTSLCSWRLLYKYSASRPSYWETPLIKHDVLGKNV